MRRWCVTIGIIAALFMLSLMHATPAVSGVDTLWTRYQPFWELWGAESRVLDVIVDPTGDIVVGGAVSYGGDGSSFGLAKFNPNGDTLWTRFLGLVISSIAGGAYRTVVDDSGYIYMTGAWSTTVKFAPNGDTVWVRNSFSRSDLIAVNSEGSVFVSDRVLGVVKLSASADTLWTSNQAGVAPVVVMGCDAIGNLYIGGPATGSGHIVAKYSASGDTLWTRPFGDWLTHIAVESDGTVYATGYAESVATGRDYKTIKFAPNGDEIWAAVSDGPNSGTDVARSVAVAPDGGVVVTGISHDTADALLTIGYSSDGDSLWAAVFEGVTQYPWTDPLCLDDSGNAYVVGAFLRIPDPAVTTIVKYSADGLERWRIDYPTIVGLTSAISVSPSYVVYVAGGDGIVAAYSQADQDDDGAIDPYDNCLTTPNPDQANHDGDSLGDACDNCPRVTNPDQAYTIALTGDVNADSVITSGDIIYMVNFIFKGGVEPSPCEAAGDANCNGACTSADIIALVGYVFKGGAPPCDVCASSPGTWSCP